MLEGMTVSSHTLAAGRLGCFKNVSPFGSELGREYIIK